MLIINNYLKYTDSSIEKYKKQISEEIQMAIKEKFNFTSNAINVKIRQRYFLFTRLAKIIELAR